MASLEPRWYYWSVYKWGYPLDACAASAAALTVTIESAFTRPKGHRRDLAPLALTDDMGSASITPYA